jgi:hypothetical protein
MTVPAVGGQRHSLHELNLLWVPAQGQGAAATTVPASSLPSPSRRRRPGSTGRKGLGAGVCGYDSQRDPGHFVYRLARPKVGTKAA